MIREFNLKDKEAVNSLLINLDYKIDLDVFNNDFLRAIVFEENKIIGVLVYQDLIDNLTIDYLIVDESFRNKGIASRMLKYIEDKHKNIINITLEVRESNNTAINFYKKNGFKSAAIRKNYYKNENGILMIKEYR